MKTLMILLLALILTSNINAQLIPQDTLDLTTYYKSIENLSCYPTTNDSPLYFKTAAVLISTFIINETIIRHDVHTGNLQHTTKKTGAIFLTGVTLSAITFSFELKQHRQKVTKSNKYNFR